MTNAQLIPAAAATFTTVIKGAVLTVGILTGLGLLLAIVVGYVIVQAVRRYQHDDDAPQPFDYLLPGDVPAAADNVPGINLGDLDDCERIWPTADLDAGCARLRAAIEEQQNGEQP